MKLKYIDKRQYSSVQEMIQQKDQLFMQLSIDEIIEELNQNHITVCKLDIKQLLKQYEVDEVIEHYHTIHDVPLDELASKMQTFDDDAIVYLINKIINEDN